MVMAKHIHIHVGKRTADQVPPNSAGEKANRFVDSCVLRASQLKKIGLAANQKAEARDLASAFAKLILEAEAGKRLAEQWLKEGPG
jgi:hypothetical protein